MAQNKVDPTERGAALGNTQDLQFGSRHHFIESDVIPPINSEEFLVDVVEREKGGGGLMVHRVA